MNNQKKLIDNLLALIVIFVSITGWDLIDYIGMNKFWIIFIVLSIILIFLIVRFIGGSISCIKSIKDILKNKINICAILLLIWCTITYFINYTGKDTVLYVAKMWVIVSAYMFITSLYLKKQSRKEILNTIFVISKYVFLLGCVDTLVAFYQFIFKTNKILGIVISDWPTYNPASFYGNVNGFGTYLYISIIAGILLVIKSNKKKSYIFALTLQCYAMYLTVARTSIIATLIFIIFTLFYIIASRKGYILKPLLNKKVILVFLCANFIGVLILFNTEIKNLELVKIEKSTKIESQQDRTAMDILIDKNEKGFNQRQFIWKAVIKDSKKYMFFGDGLKYNIVKKINVAKVISERSVGVDRISYHNTLFRYFASHGLIGMLLFLLLIAYGPLTLIFRMIKYKKVDSLYILYIIFSATIFAYMQMEEVYIGEIGMIQLVNLINLTLGGYLINENLNDKKL